MNTKRNRRPTNYYIDSDTTKDFRIIAFMLGRTASSLIEELLKDYVANNKSIVDTMIFQQLKKNNNEGVCLTCGKNTTFLSTRIGYLKFCSPKCFSDYSCRMKAYESSLRKSPAYCF